MEKTISLLIVGCFICLIGGCQIGYMGACKKYSVIKANANTIPYKIEVINAQRAALKAADKVMEKNELFDTDGSDTMAKYLELAHKVDSLYQLEE